jgi:hypothetical protein
MTGTPPKRVTDLRRAITAAAKLRGITERRLVALVGNVVVAQMLPDSAVKGGTGIKLRLGEQVTRETPDLDTAYRGDLNLFRQQLTQRLASGWGQFTGTVVTGEAHAPKTVPVGYAMQPFRVTLRYAGKVFKAVDLEVGYDELEATTREAPEYQLSSEVVELFAALDLPAPDPVRVQPAHHQLAQKIHACTEPGSDRAHDLVDLQLLAPLSDPSTVAHTCRRLFAFRGTHPWPPTVIAGPRWPSIYADAACGLNVLADIDAATDWLNGYIADIVGATTHLSPDDRRRQPTAG